MKHLIAFIILAIIACLTGGCAQQQSSGGWGAGPAMQIKLVDDGQP